MPFRPVRFLHAADLWIDHALSGTGPLSGANRGIAEEATMTAFERVVTAAIEHRVDFLLLAGNVFADEDRSVRARVALRDAFDRMRDEQIRVFVTPGRADTPDAWRDVPDLPENVTILFPDDGESVAVIRNGHVLASVAVGGKPANGLLPTNGTPSAIATGRSTAEDPASSSGDEQRRGPFTVVVVSEGIHSAEQLNASSCDYVALGGEGPRQTVSTAAGIAHHPGSTQGLSRAETGPHGCTLVQVDSDRNIDTQFVPTAPVRWECPAATVGEEASLEQLRSQMRRDWDAISPEPAEALWLVIWRVNGCGRLFDSLDEDASLWSACVDSLEQESVPEGADSQRLEIVHRFCLVSPPTETEPPHDDSAVAAESAGGNRLADQYARTLAEGGVSSEDSLRACLETVSGLDPAHTQRLQSLLPVLNREAIETAVGRLGRNWFAETPDEGGRL